MRKNKNLWLTLGCTALIAGLTFGYVMIRDGGFLTISADFNHQQLPFTASAWEGVRSGRSWVWGLDLGSSLVNAFGFYNLGSPFFWITLLFPKGSFPYLVGFLYIWKYVMASGTAFLYIRRFTKEQNAIVGALIYAFSGFQTTNLIFYHFHDVVAFFPLLLLALEDALKEGKRTGFILAVFLNCLVNYFFFVQEVIFLFFYFVARTLGERSGREIAREAVKCLFCGLLGVGMAGILFVPGVLYVLGGDRSGVQLDWSAHLQLEEWLEVIKGFLFPGDTMDGLSAIERISFRSTSCYLPMFGISFAVAYTAKKRDWLGRLLILLIILALLPWGNALFTLLTDVYHRWWYMLTLMMSLATARVLDQPGKYPVKKALRWNLMLIIGAFLVIRFLPGEGTTGNLVLDDRRFLIYTALAAAGIVFLLLTAKGRLRGWIVVGATGVFCLSTTLFTLVSYRGHAENHEEVKRDYQLGTQLYLPDEQYRFRSYENLLTMPGNVGGDGAFTSTAETESYRFNSLFDRYVATHTGFRDLVEWVPQLVGAKYRITEDGENENILYSLEADGQAYYILEDDACPIGFAVDRYLSKETLLTLPQERRALALMNAMIAENQLQDVVKEAGLVEMMASEAERLEAHESISRTVENKVADFKRSGHGFSCHTNWNEDRFVYFTVSYSQGWEAQVDGIKRPIYYSGGMMVLQIPAGEHETVFTYQTPGLRTGMMISICSILCFFGILILSASRKKRDILHQQKSLIYS